MFASVRNIGCSLAVVLLATLPCLGMEAGKLPAGTNSAVEGKKDAKVAVAAGSTDVTGGAGSDQEKDDDEKSVQEQLDELKKEVQKMRKEADARHSIEITENEKSKKEEEILSGIGREYILLKKGTLGLEYNLTYSYFSDDIIQTSSGSTIVDERSNHNLTNAVFAEYALRDNLTANINIPFVYKYNRVGSSSETDVNDLGDVAMGLQWQPFKAGGDFPAAIFNTSVTFPLGLSPYDVVLDEELPTGQGFYSVSGGVSLSKTVDPLIAFGSLNYTYNFPAEGLDQKWRDGRVLAEVDPGSSIGLAYGMAFALSYKATLNLSHQFSYSFGNEYHFQNAASVKSGSAVSSQFSIGTGWKLTPLRSVNLKLGIGLTANDPDFTFSLRIPFEF